jgi:predicted nucleic acid-binding protein
LIDANVIVYAAVPSKYRDACLEILEAVAEGKADGRFRPPSSRRSGTSN